MKNDENRHFYVSRPYQAAMVLINAMPLIHLAALAGVLFWLDKIWWWKVCWFGIVLYLLPPVLCRLALLIFPIKSSRIAIGTRHYLVWWFTANLQTIFLRLSFLDEGLRFVPGLYSLWIRLWGGKVGRLTYWAPGVQILDRPFIHIGDHVIFGAGVRITPHVIVKSEAEGMVLLLDPVSVGDNCVIGGYSLLTAGTRVADGECTRAFFISPPFSEWSGGRRLKAGRGKNSNNLASFKSNHD